VRLEGLGELKNTMTSSGMEPATFWFCNIVPQATTLLKTNLFYVSEEHIASIFRGEESQESSLKQTSSFMLERIWKKVVVA
jgi:hypothetical protein